MIKTLINYFIIELCVDTFFEQLERNFSHVNVPLEIDDEDDEDYIWDEDIITIIDANDQEIDLVYVGDTGDGMVQYQGPTGETYFYPREFLEDIECELDEE